MSEKTFSFNQLVFLGQNRQICVLDEIAIAMAIRIVCCSCVPNF
jgi:hypothetical protein